MFTWIDKILRGFKQVFNEYDYLIGSFLYYSYLCGYPTCIVPPVKDRT